LRALATKDIQSLSTSSGWSQAFELKLEHTRIVVESRLGHQSLNQGFPGFLGQFHDGA
jgi:hypothetical protein